MNGPMALARLSVCPAAALPIITAPCARRRLARTLIRLSVAEIMKIEGAGRPSRVRRDTKEEREGTMR